MSYRHSAIIKSLSLAAFLITLCAGCSEDNPQQAATLRPADLLPASGEISGWDKGDFVEMDDDAALLDEINGGAEIYIQHGFVEGVIQDYEGTIGGEAAILTLWIFDQGSASNAEDLFGEEGLNLGNLTPWEAGDEAVIDMALFHITIHLRADRFYVRVVIDKNDDEVAALATAQDFALSVADGIN